MNITACGKNKYCVGLAVVTLAFMLAYGANVQADIGQLLEELIIKEPKTPDEVLLFMASSLNENILFALAGYTETPAKVADVLLQQNLDDSMLCRIARHQRLSLAAINQLAQSTNAEVRSCIASNPITPATVLYHLCHDREPRVRSGVALNPNLPESVLKILMQDDHGWVKISIIMNHNTAPLERLVDMSNDTSEAARMVVAENPRTPELVLLKLADDPSNQVKESLARNLNLPIKVAWKLGKEGNCDIRQSLAHNPAVPAEILYYLLQHAKQGDINVIVGVAYNPNLTKNLTDYLLSHHYRQINNCLAKNEVAHSEALAKLAEDPDPEIRALVAQHPTTSLATLTKLSNDKEIYVQLHVTWNPNTPGNVLAKIDAQLSDRKGYRDNIARHANTPSATLADLAHRLQKETAYALVWTRYLIAINANTPSETLTLLSQDANAYVRCAAKKYLADRKK